MFLDAVVGPALALEVAEQLLLPVLLVAAVVAVTALLIYKLIKKRKTNY